jgi:hypothetical protein
MRAQIWPPVLGGADTAPRPASPLQRPPARLHLLPHRCTASPGTPHRAGSAASLHQWRTAPPPSARELAPATTSSTTGATPGHDRLANTEAPPRHATPAVPPLCAKKRRGSLPPSPPTSGGRVLPPPSSPAAAATRGSPDLELSLRVWVPSLFDNEVQ